MKRLQTGVAVLVAALLMVTGCRQTETRTPPPEPTGAYEAEYRDRACYTQLDARLQKAYAAVYEAITDHGDEDGVIALAGEADDAEAAYGIKIQLPTPLSSKEDVSALYTAFTRDNPQFFYIGRYYRCEGYQQDGHDYFDTLHLTFTMPADQRRIAREQLAGAVTELTQGLPAATETDTELVLHDRLVTRCHYDKIALEEGVDDHPNAYTAYGALVEKSAVCEGYAKGMQLLLNAMGIACTPVSGANTEDGRAHMWNLVTVDGATYHIDVTWDDPDDRLIHTYFNLTDEEIRRSHQMDEVNPGVIPTAAEPAGYYRFTGRYLDDRSTDVIDVAIAGAVREHYATIDLQFSEKTYSAAKTYILEGSRLKKAVDALLRDDGMALWNCQLLCNDTYHTITLFKKEAA